MLAKSGLIWGSSQTLPLISVEHRVFFIQSDRQNFRYMAPPLASGLGWKKAAHPVHVVLWLREWSGPRDYTYLASGINNIIIDKTRDQD